MQIKKYCKVLRKIHFADFHELLFEASIPLVVMSESADRDEVGVLLLAEELYRIRSSCAFAVIKGGGKTLELVTEGIQRFPVNSVFCLSSDCLWISNQQLMPIGPYNIIDV